MAQPLVFISYKHDNPTTKIAKQLYDALQAVADGLGIEGVFMDVNAIEPADLFDRVILDALDRTTHFIALIDNKYWVSDYCRKELTHVIKRYEADRNSVRPLFVKAGPIKEELMSFDKDRKSGRLTGDDPLVKRLGDVQFLGPFDANQRLVRLAWENEAELGDQMASLIDGLERTLRRRVR